MHIEFMSFMFSNKLKENLKLIKLINKNLKNIKNNNFNKIW